MPAPEQQFSVDANRVIDRQAAVIGQQQTQIIALTLQLEELAAIKQALEQIVSQIQGASDDGTSDDTASSDADHQGVSEPAS